MICVLQALPYWNILSQKRTVYEKRVKDYSSKSYNLSSIFDYNEYLTKIQLIFQDIHDVLKSNSYCIVNVMDLRKKNTFFPLHIDICQNMISLGFELDDIIIWDRRIDYNNLKPLGYPYVFRVNKVHEFLLIFKKNIPNTTKSKFN